MKEEYFEELMAAKSDEELETYIQNRAKYVPKAVRVAIAEMQKRGHVFSDEELGTFEQDFKKRVEFVKRRKKKRRAVAIPLIIIGLLIEYE